MDFHCAQEGALDVVAVRGKLDYAASSEFESRLRQLLDQPGRRFFLMDFSEVTVLSSPSLRAILSMAKRLRRVSGQFAIVRPSEVALECFKISGFLKLRLFAVEMDLAVARENLLKLSEQSDLAPEEQKSEPPAPPSPPSPVQLAAAPQETETPPPNPFLAQSAAQSPREARSLETVAATPPQTTAKAEPTPASEVPAASGDASKKRERFEALGRILRYLISEVKAACAYWFRRRDP